jgi:hypothetical protein
MIPQAVRPPQTHDEEWNKRERHRNHTPPANWGRFVRFSARLIEIHGSKVIEKAHKNYDQQDRDHSDEKPM